jgi:hypothetical protein
MPYQDKLFFGDLRANYLFTRGGISGFITGLTA